MESQYIIEMLNIRKEFPGIVANDDITLQLRRGEIHALLGENGAGKSTLMSVLFGLYQPEAGVIKKNGQVVHINNPNDATALNIGMVHQHFKLVDVLTAAENIVLGLKEPGRLDMNKVAKKVKAICDAYGFDVDPNQKIYNMSVSQKQTVEIVKVLYRGADILILDEPTAVLTPQETDKLFTVMRNMKADGKSLIIITHKLHEVLDVSDRVAVLRKGEYIGDVMTKDADQQSLTDMMVGRSVNFHVEKKPMEPGEVVLEVKNMTMASKIHKNNAVKDVSFQVRRGEIVCIAGIDGNGQTELVYGLTGLEPMVSGKIRLCGKDISNASIRERSVMGMSHIPEDRHKHGLVLDYTVADNMVLQRYWQPEFQKGGFIRADKVREYSDRLIEQYDVRSGQGPITRARSMSGGNQQKAIIAREVDRDKDLIVAVQPTRGLDVGAIEFIHSQLVAERDRGKAILLVSLELDEVMSLSDRILVMYEGEIVGELDPKQTNVQELGLYMSGAKRNTKGGAQA